MQAGVAVLSAIVLMALLKVAPSPPAPCAAASGAPPCAAGLVLAQTPSAPPLSQPAPYRPYQARPSAGAPLKAEEVATRLAAHGFVDVSRVRQRGRSILAEATGPRGERVRLVLDAASGEISGMQVIGFGGAR